MAAPSERATTGRGAPSIKPPPVVARLRYGRTVGTRDHRSRLYGRAYTSAMPAEDSPPPTRRLIEVGWLIVNRLPSSHDRALNAARQCLLERLREAFPAFDWRLQPIRKPEPTPRAPEEPVELLDEGVHEKESRHLDFMLVITAADLRAYYKPFALAVPSRAINTAVLSIHRLAAEDDDTLDDEGLESRLSGRVCALAMHLLGDLNGMAHSEEPGDVMYEPRRVDDLDTMRRFDPEGAAAMETELHDVADVRLEEAAHGRRLGAAAFYVRAAWINRDDICSAILQAKPWEFPLRLSRLTTAAMSALVVLLMTAEVWDLGTSRPLPLVLGLSLITWLGTTCYTVKRQRLLVRRNTQTAGASRRPRLTEQAVMTNISISVVVLAGLATIYLSLFLLTLLLSVTLFAGGVAEEWAMLLTARGVTRLGPLHYLAMAGVVASLGLIVGALGGNFEGQGYFRHIAYADEET